MPQEDQRIDQLKLAIAFFRGNLPHSYSLYQVDAAIEGAETILKWLHSQRQRIQVSDATKATS